MIKWFSGPSEVNTGSLLNLTNCTFLQVLFCVFFGEYHFPNPKSDTLGEAEKKTIRDMLFLCLNNTISTYFDDLWKH